MKRALILLAVVSLTASTAAAIGIPDLSHAYWTCRTDAPATVIACPAGDGTPLSAALPHDGGPPVDATIDVVVLDSLDQPIFLYPFEDIWLEASGLVPCISGTIADTNTDMQGRTTISVLYAGGQAPAGTIHVMLSGEAIQGSAPNLRIVSPDLSGDGVVNVSDLALMASDYAGAFNERSDMDGDGVVNLTDVVFLIRHFMHACP